MENLKTFIIIQRDDEFTRSLCTYKANFGDKSEIFYSMKADDA